jgi:hypothetical protein
MELTALTATVRRFLLLNRFFLLVSEWEVDVVDALLGGSRRRDGGVE